MSDEYERDDEEEYKPPIKPPSMPPPTVTPPSQPPSPPPQYQSEPIVPTRPSQAEFDAASGQISQQQNTINNLQIQVNQLNSQVVSLRTQLSEKENSISQLNGQLQNSRGTLENYQNQINQLNNEKAQFQAMIPELQSQLQQLQQENMALQQQIGPLQANINKLQEELSYKDKRIQELKEPKAVMPSSLAQGITSQEQNIGRSSQFGPSSQTISPKPVSEGIGLSGRRICPNCGASGFAIKEVEDRTKIISYIPKPQYAKKNVCTKCGFEF